MVSISGKVNNLNVNVYYHNPGHDGSQYDRLLNFMGQVWLIDNKPFFVVALSILVIWSVWMPSLRGQWMDYSYMLGVLGNLPTASGSIDWRHSCPSLVTPL